MLEKVQFWAVLLWMILMALLGVWAVRSLLADTNAQAKAAPEPDVAPGPDKPGKEDPPR